MPGRKNPESGGQNFRIDLCRRQTNTQVVLIVAVSVFMKLFLSSLMFMQFTLGFASAQEVEPSPSATASPQSESAQMPAASPTPSPTPEMQKAPQLLPESNALPPRPAERVLPPDMMPQGVKPQIPGAILNPTSAEQLEKDRVRFRQLRTIAARDPYAIYLSRKAGTEQTDELKREYLRVYYITMCDIMRKVEPRLKTLIDTFEALNISRTAPLGIRPTVPARDVPRYEASLRHRQP